MGVGSLFSAKKPAISLKWNKIGPRLLLTTNRKSIHAFDWCQNQRPWMTLKGHYALCFKTQASFGAHHEKVNEDRPILSAARMWAIDSSFWRHKVCADILRGSLSNDSGVIENVDFHGFWTSSAP